jgi:hypothetical protein
MIDDMLLVPELAPTIGLLVEPSFYVPPHPLMPNLGVWGLPEVSRDLMYKVLIGEGIALLVVPYW